MARQGVQYLTLDRQRVADPATMADVPADGATIGELMLRSNTLMKGYLANPAATGEAFAGGWFHTGDLAVMHPDGYIEIKDRSKDIIISGGENISSIEVEEVLYRHPQVMEAAVVARPDERWGESPCAFVTLKPDAGAVTADDIIPWCRANLGALQGAEDGRVRTAAEDLDRQDPEIRAAGAGQGNAAVTGNSVATLEEKIRNFINSPRKQATLLSDTASWNRLCSALDVIGDTDLALDTYLRWEPQTGDGENYLLVYGTLQVMEVQQDAIKFVCEILCVPYQRPKELFDIRAIRSESIGHPMKNTDNKITKSSFISRSELDHRGFTLLTVYSDNSPYRHLHVDLVTLVKTQQEFIKNTLVGTVDKLQIDEMAHRTKHKTELLQELFPDTLGYLISKIYENSPVAELHVREIKGMISRFREALQKRDEWIDGSSITDKVELAEYPLEVLSPFLVLLASLD